AGPGRVLGRRWGPSAFLRPPDVAGRFAEGYRAGGQTVELPDVRWCLDARTGRTLCSLPAPAADAVAGVGPDGKGRWRYDIPGPTTLTGEPPELLDLPGAGPKRSRLLIVCHNYGSTLQRLDDG